MQISKSKTSAELLINKRPIIEPMKWEPTSPRIILAGFVFHHKKPKQAPATDEINIEISRDKYSSKTKFE